ncbi:MAG: hypothetical protein AAFR16_06465 [Pseudomonadota bacterium]
MRACLSTTLCALAATACSSPAPSTAPPPPSPTAISPEIQRRAAEAAAALARAPTDGLTRLQAAALTETYRACFVDRSNLRAARSGRARRSAWGSSWRSPLRWRW